MRRTAIVASVLSALSLSACFGVMLAHIWTTGSLSRHLNDTGAWFFVLSTALGLAAGALWAIDAEVNDR